MNFITIHYAYFLGTCLVSAIIFWGASTPSQKVTFTDSLFLTVSAMTESGLNTINLSTLNTFQQFMLFALIMLGSSVGVSSVVIFVRKNAFEKRFTHIVQEQRAKRKLRNEVEVSSFCSSTTKRDQDASEKGGASRGLDVDGIVVRGRAIASLENESLSLPPSFNPGDHPPLERQQHARASIDSNPCADERHQAKDKDLATTQSNPNNGSSGARKVEEFEDAISPTAPTIRFQEASLPTSRRHRRVLSMSGVGARPDLLNHPSMAHYYGTPLPSATLTGRGEWGRRSLSKYFIFGGKIGRNSQFHSLSPAEREKLGGVEYRAIKLLGIVVPLYFVLFQLLGCLALGAWVTNNAPNTALQNGLNPWWVGAFNAVSAFNNSGMSLIDANMIAFQFSDYMLITMGLLILAGNTCYPIFLRLIFWTIWKLTPASESWTESKIALRFILDHPRRLYTNLFPSYHTWFLLGSVIALNGTDWFAFEVLNIGNPVTSALPTNVRVIDGLFQAFAVRSGGFYVVPIANISIALQVLYVLMMYISVYPVTMTIRNSNVYEERSLGIYADDDPVEKPPASDEKQFSGFVGKLRRHLTNQRLFVETGAYSRGYFIQQQLRSQLAHDLWWICLAVLFIMIIEGGQFAADPVAYSVFNVIFETVSAYGTVGISVGLPNEAYSFCGGWHVLSKLILCAVMIRGRHRGLPVAIDRAVLLPGEHLAAAEEEDARLRAERTVERTSTAVERSMSRERPRTRDQASEHDAIV